MPYTNVEKRREANRRSYEKHRSERIGKVRSYRLYYKERINLALRAKRRDNPEKYRETYRRYYERNIEKWRDYNQSEKRKESIRRYRERISKSQPEIFRIYSAKRRACILRATPDWLTREDHDRIAQFYRDAVLLEEETGEKHEVDHVVPLRGKIVCGLHVPWNLQVLPKMMHNRKDKRYRNE